MIYEKIVDLCRQKGITVARLERENGLGNATVRRWKKSTPRVETLKVIADYFNVTLDYFME